MFKNLPFIEFDPSFFTAVVFDSSQINIFFILCNITKFDSLYLELMMSLLILLSSDNQYLTSLLPHLLDCALLDSTTLQPKNARFSLSNVYLA